MSVTRPLVVIVAAVGAAFLAGDGDGAAPDPRAAKRAIAQTDQSAAMSIVIQPRDLRGWKSLGVRFPSGDGGGCPKFKPNRSAHTITGEGLGLQLGRRQRTADLVVTSAVWAYETPSDAVGEFRFDTAAGAVACDRDQLSMAAPTGSLTVSDLPQSLNLPHVASQQFARRHRVLWFAGGGQHGSIYLDTIYLRNGRAEATLIVQRVGEEDQPPPAEVERQLVTLLGARLGKAFR